MAVDFSGLTDDQLVALFRELCQEAARRNPAVQAAMHEAGLDEAEKTRIYANAAEKEAERLRQEEAARVAAQAAEQVRRETEAARVAAETQRNQAKWAERDALSIRVTEIFEQKVKISVWAKDGDKRLYFDPLSGRAYGEDPLAMYAITGSDRYKPGNAYHLPERIKGDPARKAEFFAIAKALANELVGTTIHCQTVSDTLKARLAERERQARLDALDGYCRGLSALAEFEAAGRAWRLRETHSTNKRGHSCQEKILVERREADGSYDHVATAVRASKSDWTEKAPRHWCEWEISPYAYKADEAEYVILASHLSEKLAALEEKS